MGAVLPGIGAACAGALIGWALVRWTNIALARLWAIVLVLLIIALFVYGMMRGADTGFTMVVVASLVLFPALVGSVVAMVLTEWRQSDR